MVSLNLSDSARPRHLLLLFYKLSADPAITLCPVALPFTSKNKGEWVKGKDFIKITQSFCVKYTVPMWHHRKTSFTFIYCSVYWGQIFFRTPDPLKSRPFCKEGLVLNTFGCILFDGFLELVWLWLGNAPNRTLPQLRPPVALDCTSKNQSKCCLMWWMVGFQFRFFGWNTLEVEF